HSDREVHGVPPTGDKLRRPWRRHHTRTAPAAVLLPAVPHDPEAPLDDIDLVGLLVLRLPGRERPATLRTRGRVVGPRVHDLDHGEGRLVARAVAAARARGARGVVPRVPAAPR